MIIAISIISFLLQIGTAAHHWDDLDCRWVDLEEGIVEIIKPESETIKPECLHFFDPESALGRNFAGVNLCGSEEERQSLLIWIKYLHEQGE